MPAARPGFDTPTSAHYHSSSFGNEHMTIELKETTGAAPAQPALACGGNQVGILGKGHYCVGRAGEPPRAPSQTASPFPHGIAVALAPCEPRGVRFPFE